MRGGTAGKPEVRLAVTAAAGAALKEYAMMPYHSRRMLADLQAALPSLQRIYGAVTELARGTAAGCRYRRLRTPSTRAPRPPKTCGATG